MSQYFAKPYEPFGEDINVRVEIMKLCNFQIMQQRQILKIFPCSYFKFCIKNKFSKFKN